MRWLSAAGKKTLDGRRPGRGIYPVVVDEAVIGAATARWTTAPMKREKAMKGCCSSAMDERHPSLVVDDGVGVAAPARWRMGWRTEEAGHSAEVVVPPMVYEWGNGGEGGAQTLGRASLKWGKLQTYPPFKISDITSVGDRTVISHLPNICL